MLKQRIITAVVLLTVIAWLLWQPNPNYWTGFICLTVVLGFREWLRLCQMTVLPQQLMAYVMFLLGLFLLITQIGQHSLPLILAGALFWLVLSNYTFRDAPSQFSVPLIKLLVGAWLLASSAYFIVGLKTIPNGNLLIVFFILLISSADIGAYFSGKKFGKHKLAPAISPGKTIEGLIGGQLLVLFVACLIIANINQNSSLLTIDNGLMLLLFMVAALFSVVGDLFESKLKRAVGLKDSGNILPGHGGILDRADSIVAGLPFYMLALHFGGFLPS